MEPSRLVDSYSRFEGTNCFHLECRREALRCEMSFIHLLTSTYMLLRLLRVLLLLILIALNCVCKNMVFVVRGVHISAVRAPGSLHFLRRHVMQVIVGIQYGACFASPVWWVELQGKVYIFGTFFFLWSNKGLVFSTPVFYVCTHV